jgi:CBS domain-containing protein
MVWAKETIQSILNEKGSEVVIVSPTSKVENLISLLSNKNIGAAMVVDSERNIMGVVSERDVIRAMAEKKSAALTLSVSTIMTSDVITCSPESSLESAMVQMVDKHFRHLPIMNKTSLEGLVSLGDLVKARVDELEKKNRDLRENIIW